MTGWPKSSGPHRPSSMMGCAHVIPTACHYTECARDSSEAMSGFASKLGTPVVLRARLDDPPYSPYIYIVYL